MARAVVVQGLRWMARVSTFATSTPVRRLTTSVGHKGKFGHEFLEFEFRSDGRLRYANNSNYRKESMIRKELCVNSLVMDELKRMVVECEVLKEDDRMWPQPDRVGRQELEIILGGEHICFSVMRRLPHWTSLV